MKQFEVRTAIAPVLVGGVLLVSACSAAAPTGATGIETDENDAAPVARSESSPQSPSPAEPESSNPGSLDPVELPASSSETEIGAAGPKSATKRPAKIEFPFKTELDVTAGIMPECVARAERIELTVTAPPESAVAYQAVYSDSQSGADAPFGGGHGGNDKGMVGPNGTFTSTWVVSPTAPVGRARVDVIVGFEGKWGYAERRFAVMDEEGDCPEKWLNGP